MTWLQDVGQLVDDKIVHHQSVYSLRSAPDCTRSSPASVHTSPVDATSATSYSGGIGDAPAIGVNRARRARNGLSQPSLETTLKFKVKTNEPSNCAAEGRHRGHIVRVFGQSDIRSDRWSLAVYLQKLGVYGQAPTTEHKLDTTSVSAGSADEVFKLGFAMAEREIDSYTKI